MKLTPEDVEKITKKHSDAIANEIADALSNVGRELTDPEFDVICTHADDAVRTFLEGIEMPNG